MNGHHLVMGQLTDFVTGAPLPDTHDERYRQKLARLLVSGKGYPLSEVRPHLLEIRMEGKYARLPVTWTVWQEGRLAMIVHYGPGSLVTRHRPALAIGRLVAPYQVPVVVVTNGESADTLCGASGKIMAMGLDGIPAAGRMAGIVRDHSWEALSTRRIEMERRIVMAFEIDDRCPCDDTVCRTEARG
jgi:hypothetical protein